MRKKKICIIGCGTYGSYLLKRILQQFGEEVDVTVIEIGNEKTRSEEEIGLHSHSDLSNVARSGRYFGLGGTSARWGGQILFFDEQDNPAGEPNWHEIVQINNRHRDGVIHQLLGEGFIRLFHQKKNGLKAGIWLKYKKRNLFNLVPKRLLRKVNLVREQRVVKLVMEENQITQVVSRGVDGKENTIAADVFYLTTGAIESCRLLMKLRNEYGVLKYTDLGKNFGDHLSVELFKVKECKPELNGALLLPVLHKGSLITRRLVVYGKDGRVGYMHPIFNK